MIWYGNVSKPSRRTILHLHDLQTIGRENTPFVSPAEIRACLSEHPEIEAVMFYAAWMPRAAVPVERVTDALLGKLFRPPTPRAGALTGELLGAWMGKQLAEPLPMGEDPFAEPDDL